MARVNGKTVSTGGDGGNAGGGSTPGTGKRGK